MKNLKKCGVLFIVLSMTQAAYSMEELETDVSDLQESLRELKGTLEDLQERVSGLEKGEKATYKICSGGKKGKCRNASAAQAHAFVRRPHRRGKHALRCHGSHCGRMKSRLGMKQQYQELRQKVGLAPLSVQELLAVRAVGTQPRGISRGGLQAYYDTFRSRLNTLLAKETLTNADIKEIKNIINEFRSKNPAQRPGPADYEEVLKKRIELMESEGEESSEEEESEEESEKED
jgi:hypothetical protein